MEQDQIQYFGSKLEAHWIQIITFGNTESRIKTSASNITAVRRHRTRVELLEFVGRHTKNLK